MAGTVWLRPMTLADAVTDLVRSLAASGIRHVLIVNGHGGNFTLEVAARELNMGSPELTVLLPPMTLRSKGPQIFETAGMEVHAGESETSVMMAIDASQSSDPLRFTNHSCRPNAVLRISQGRVELYAMRDIASGEEITVNYGETHHEGRLRCRCGAVGCVGRI